MGARAKRPMFAPLPLDTTDQHGDEDNDYTTDSKSSKDFSNGKGGDGALN